MTSRFLFIPLVAFVTVAACKRDGIQTYLAPKETAAMPPMSAGGDAMDGGPAVPETGSQTQPHITWKTPEGWQEQPASSMRVASYLVKGKNGETADVSLVPLSGDAGGDLANINRWRGQIQLGPLTDGELDQQSRILTIHGRRLRWVDFVSAKPLNGASGLNRIMAAIYKNDEQTWFFKMTGDDATVREAQAEFRDLIRTELPNLHAR